MILSRLFRRNERRGAAKSDPVNPMQGFIQPLYWDRWLAPQVSWYTPAMVETIIREAMGGDLTRQWELFDLMERTWPRLQGNLKKLRERVCAVEWSVMPWTSGGDAPTDSAAEKARLLDDAIWHMAPDVLADENDFEGLLFDLLDGWGKGISVQEVHWQMTRVGGRSLVVPRAASWITPKLYGYPARTDMQDRLMLRAEAVSGSIPRSAASHSAQQWIEFPRDKFLFGIAKAKSGHPTGAAMLQPLGFFWAAQNFAHEWFLNYAQLFGVPIRWANYKEPADPDRVAKIEDMLSTMGSSAWAAFPEGTQLNILDAVRSAGANPQTELITGADRACDILVLGQTLTTDVSDSGSRALGDVHAGTLSDREKAVARWAARVLNTQLVPAWCRLNWGNTDECPYFQPAIEKSEDVKQLAEGLEVARRIGVRIPMVWAHERLQIPLPKADEDVLESGIPANPPLGVTDPDDPDAAGHDAAATPPGTRDATARSCCGGREVMARETPQDRLAARIAEDITGVAHEWLGGALPWFGRLVRAAENPEISDADFIALLERAQANLPGELAPLLNMDSLAASMEAAMGTACVNGAVAGYLRRQPSTRSTDSTKP